MTTIQDYITSKEVNDKLSHQDLVDHLEVSASMVSKYRKDYNASLEVAKTVYRKSGVVLHPYSGESLIIEIEKEAKTSKHKQLIFEGLK